MIGHLTVARIADGLLRAAMLLAVAGAAHADEISYGEAPIDVDVTIAPLTGPGALSLTVSRTSTALAEDGSTALVRQFTETLPTVTVTDTRAPEDIPADAAWYVLGTATDFTAEAG